LILWNWNQNSNFQTNWSWNQIPLPISIVELGNRTQIFGKLFLNKIELEPDLIFRNGTKTGAEFYL
jgi:hypothetical protein